MNGTTVVRARGISKQFPDGRTVRDVLHGVDLSVAKGELLVLQGPSGCGKTTLIGILCGIIAPDRGTVEIAGEQMDVHQRKHAKDLRRRAIGLISQRLGLVDEETAAWNVELAVRFGGHTTSRARRKERIRESLVALGLPADASTPVRWLSGGERQRVAIARATITNPAVILADEPTAALDRTNADIVIGLLREAADAGAGIIVTTHDDHVARAADRVLCLTDGAVTVPVHE